MTWMILGWLRGTRHSTKPRIYAADLVIDLRFLDGFNGYIVTKKSMQDHVFVGVELQNQFLFFFGYMSYSCIWLYTQLGRNLKGHRIVEMSWSGVILWKPNLSSEFHQVQNYRNIGDTTIWWYHYYSFFDLASPALCFRSVDHQRQ